MNLPEKKPLIPDKSKLPYSGSGESLFKKRGVGLTRGEMRRELGKTPYSSNVKMLREERVKLEKELFPYQKYGPDISQKDVDRRLFILNKEKFKAQGSDEKLKIQHEINLLNDLKNKKLK